MIVGVIGAGTMGSGIAEVAAQKAQVIMVDVHLEYAEAGLQAIARSLIARWTGGDILILLSEMRFWRESKSAMICRSCRMLILFWRPPWRIWKQKRNLCRPRRDLFRAVHSGHEHFCPERYSYCHRYR